MRKIKNPKIGEYVLLTRWGDAMIHDPWVIGFLSKKEEGAYYVNDVNRHYKHCFKINKEQGERILNTSSRSDLVFHNKFRIRDILKLKI